MKYVFLGWLLDELEAFYNTAEGMDIIDVEAEILSLMERIKDVINGKLPWGCK